MTTAVLALIADSGTGSVPGPLAVTLAPGCGKYCSAKIAFAPDGRRGTR